MKPPTAPIYPDLNGSTDDGHNYRLQKISDVEKQLLVESGLRKALYKNINGESILQMGLILY